MFDTFGGVQLKQIKADKLRVLAVTTVLRSEGFCQIFHR